MQSGSLQDKVSYKASVSLMESEAGQEWEFLPKNLLGILSRNVLRVSRINRIGSKALLRVNLLLFPILSSKWT